MRITPLDALAQNIRALFWQDGALYLVCGDTTSSTMYLVRADIADGSAQALALEGYVHLSSYRDGLLLGIRGAEGGNQAVLLDAATGEVQEALGTPADLRGICWAQERGTFYAMVDGHARPLGRHGLAVYPCLRFARGGQLPGRAG